MKKLDFGRLKGLVKSFPKAKILVIGDLILDEFIWGRVSRISPEAPIPVVWVNSESLHPGGACNVASNIRSLGGRVSVMGVVGRDERGRALIELLRQRGIGANGIWSDPGRPTTLKTRVIAHNQQVVRIDREQIHGLSKAVRNRMLDKLKRFIPKVDAICIEDYGKGVITPELVHEIVRLGRKQGKIISVDPKENHLSYYKGVTSITPNHHEAAALTQIAMDGDETLHKAGAKLLRTLRCENVLITRGESGMCLFQKGRKPVKIATMAQDVYDVSGAGDTVIGTFTLASALRATALESAHLANCAAGIVVGKVGTATVDRKELLDRVKQVMQNE